MLYIACCLLNCFVPRPWVFSLFVEFLAITVYVSFAALHLCIAVYSFISVLVLPVSDSIVHQLQYSLSSISFSQSSLLLVFFPVFSVVLIPLAFETAYL